MARPWLIAFGVVAIAMFGCDRQQPVRTFTEPSTRPADVPAAGVLTPAIAEDGKAAVKFATDGNITKAVNDFVGKSVKRWELTAARQVGEYVLLWIAFPGVADGGVSLVYSQKEHRIICTFLGGILG